MIILYCDQLWAGGEDVKENEGRRPKWSKASPRNPLADYGSWDREGMSLHFIIPLLSSDLPPDSKTNTPPPPSDSKTNTSPDGCSGAIPPLRDLNILDVNSMLYD